MAKKRELNKFHLIFFIKILIIGFIIYQQFFILSLREEVNLGMSNLQNDLNEGFSSVGGKITTIDTRISNLNKERIEADGKILDALGELEESSKNQIEDLSMEIKDVQIKSKDFSVIIDDVLPSVVGVAAGQSLGSGVVVAEDGFLVTNYHVIDSSDSYRVFTSDERVYDAQLIGYNVPVDVAVLKINSNSLDYLDFTDSETVGVGDKVIAVGNPFGLSFSVTEGIVSAVNREGPNGLNVYIQTDVPINPGNSGGPLVNLNKEIVGINNFKIGEAEGLGFALQADTAEEIAFGIIDEYKASLEVQ